MAISKENARRLAAARDISAVLVFCAAVFFGGRAVLDSPFLQKERVNRREAEGDIAAFFERIEKTHPYRLARMTAGQYAELKSSTTAQAEARLDEFGRIKVGDLAYALYLAAAAFGDGGTRLLWEPPHKWKDPDLKFPPFSAADRDGKYVIEHSLDPSMNGAELLEVNGRPFGEFIAPVLRRVAGETPRYRAYVFCRDQAFWWDFSGVFAGDPRITVKVKSPAGKVYSRSLSAVTAGEFRRMTWAPAPVKKEIYAQKKVAWLNVSGMRYTRSERGMYSRFFRELKEQGIEDLVLDMRGNSAGDARVSDHVLSYLADGFSRKPEYRFAGRTILLTGPGSGSAAAFFAVRFRELKAGEILGRETGGTPDHFGSPEEFSLPASGIPFSVSTRHYPGPAEPVKPDLELTPGVLRPHKGDVKAFVLDRIGGRREQNRK